MTVIESVTHIKLPVDEVFKFLSNLKNHRQLMPENIYNWSSTENQASFTIQNMAKLTVKISEYQENKALTAVPIEKAPFDVELKWTVENDNHGGTIAKHIISADLNMMMKMIAAGPLQKLADHQTKKLKEILG